MKRDDGNQGRRILYHYCSVDSFFSIISSRKIRLSSLLLANDSQEGLLVRRRLMEIADGYGLGVAEQQALAQELEAFESENHGYGFCLSAAKDRLSQWRGYANDGQGFAIGFDSDSLHEVAEGASLQSGQLQVFMRELVYGAEAQRRSLEPAFEQMAGAIAQGGLDRDSSRYVGSVFGEKDTPQAYWRIASAAREALGRTVDGLYLHLYGMKSDAFVEEEEVRLLSLISSSGYGLTRYRPTHNKLIPYVEIDIAGDLAGLIREVWLGPKNQTPRGLVYQFLESEGYPGTPIHISSASYR